jgi:murein L,D-transpeptidase YafK
MPAKFLAVDKDQQRFMIFGKKSPLRIMADLTCATGQKLGDKLERGDLKTPEGVYFVGRRLSKGLDFELYGGLAFTLNFPNPVDIIKGKTGSGIWIHGRGTPIKPRETKGCVALHLPDLKAVENELEVGTPVAIAKSLDWKSDTFNSDIDVLVDRVSQWAGAWQNKSDEFFALYDTDKFSKSRRRSFSSFKRHKQRVFAAQEWIQVMTHDVRVLPGPDYWVTYFNQYYRTPSMISQGVKRLYWMKNGKGEFKIVGREWLRRPVSLTGEYLDRVEAEIAPVIEEWVSAWQRADLAEYSSFYAQDARQSDRRGLTEVMEYKRDLWRRAEPSSVSIGDIRVEMAPEGVSAEFVQEYSSAGGYSDKGVKKLVLAPASAGGWKIVSEDWRPL